MDESTVYVFGNYRLDLSKRQLFSLGFPIKLGGRAFDVLHALIERNERTVSKQELLDLAWPRLVVEENNLQVQIATLRKLLGHGAIATIPGRGYRFTMPVTREGVRDDGVAQPQPPVPAAQSPRSNVPRWAPQLLGRAEELANLMGLLQTQAMVSVVGPAGIGKSRLAMSAAQSWLVQVDGFACWVDLSGLTDPSALPNAVVSAMGLELHGKEDPFPKIQAHLNSAPSLLLLDNCEHLLDGVAAFLGRLRSSMEQLVVLITSQEPVRAAEEHVFRLDPLALPGDDSLLAIATSGAGALFAARAQASDRHFQLTEANGAAVADICRRLDGIPLAIELAAARVSLLGVQGLRQRLDERFQVLTTTDRSARRRYRTLYEALDWSHQLLTKQEKIVFRRLGVFAGTFSMEAAQAVAEDEEGMDRWEVLEHMGSLVEKSLVVAEGIPIPRYRVLESLRLFALERLMESNEVDTTRSAHRDYYLHVVEAAQEAVSAGLPAGLPVLDTDRDNLFLALAWQRGDDNGQKGLRLASAMHRYWTSRGMVVRGLHFLREALNHPGVRGASRPRLVAEMSAAMFSALAGEHDQSVAHAMRAAGYASELRDDSVLSTAVARLGMMQLRRGDIDAAARCSQEALVIARRVGKVQPLCVALELLSSVESKRGHLDKAREAEEEILRTHIKQGSSARDMLVAHLNLAWTTLQLEDEATARQHLLTGLDLLTQVDSELYGAYLLRVAAGLAAFNQQAAVAVQLAAAYEAQGSRMGVHEPYEPSEAVRIRAARGALPESDLERVDKVARGWSYEGAIAFASAALAPQPALRQGAVREHRAH